MKELACAKIQEMLLNSSIHDDCLETDALEHIQHCSECHDYARICCMISSTQIMPAELSERTRLHCHAILQTASRRHKAARIRTWSIYAGIAALFAILLSIAVLDNHVNAPKDSITVPDDHFDGLFDETELSLVAEETATINLELDLFASEIY